MKIKSICAFCGSSMGTDPGFAAEAGKTGGIIAEKNISLVYGGGNAGLMSILASAALSGGVKVTGIITELISRKIKPLSGVETIIVESMHERKAKMYELADAFIALPGGPGTLEELFEVFTWKQLGYHAKPVGVLNTMGYYSSFISMLDRAVESGFLKQEHRESIIVEESPAVLIEKMEKHRHVYTDKWIRSGLQ